jgi:beta-lactamase class D
MKKYCTDIVLLAAILLLFMSNGLAKAGAPDTVNDVGLRKSLEKQIAEWHKFAAAANLDAYIGMMSNNAVFIGTDPSEKWTREKFRTFCAPYFAKKRTWDFRAAERSVTISKNRETAWFDEVLSTQMGICRGSGVMVRVGSDWKIAQYVLSPTVPNSIMKQVTALKAAEDTAGIFGMVFSRYGLSGTFVLLDPEKGKWSGYNSALWDSGFIPASTFKVPNSLIGLDLGVIDTSYVFKWDGRKRSLSRWEHDMRLEEAFRLSCVPCYQEVARKIGTANMKKYLAEFSYGKMLVSDSTIDNFWLEGNSRISPRQQVLFLQKLHDGKLPLKPSAVNTVKKMMVNEKGKNWVLSGKTGWAVREGRNYGWFVGWLESDGKVYYLATLVMPQDDKLPADFGMARVSVTREILGLLKLIND